LAADREYSEPFGKYMIVTSHVQVKSCMWVTVL